ncbi:hypothetical protein Gohar_003124, partial [Gossypium harknessii]|nr:hypothetical protein [Gossypium harknessii]
MMLVVNPPGTINQTQTFLGNTLLHSKLPCVSKPAIHHSLPGIHSNNVVHIHSSLPSWKDSSKLTTYLVPHRVAPKRWLCQSHGSASSDDEYKSSRNIAISLFRRYRNVIDRGGGDNLKEFISAGVNAYALGCTDEGLRKELIAMKESGIEIDVMHSYGGSTSVKSKICAEEVSDDLTYFSSYFCSRDPLVLPAIFHNLAA